MTDHLSKVGVKQKGFFEKKDEKNEKNNYKSQCKEGGRGYQSYWSEAHHVLPAEAIEKAVEASTGKDDYKLKYIRFVQHITPWNINDKSNLVGLPHVICFALYYQNKINPKASYSKVEGFFKHFKTFSAKSRRKALSRIKVENPEKWPIHNPVNWGHTAYTAEVVQEIKVNVWDIIKYEQKEHILEAEAVKTELEGWADENFNWLEKRGKKGMSAEAWALRVDEDENDWYGPYTMYDVDNPIFS